MPRPSSATVTELSGWIVDVDGVAVAGERLVDRVVDHLVDEVVQAANAGRADVHAGPLAHRLEALEDGDVLGVVPGALLVGLAVVCATVPPSTHATPRRHGAVPGPGRNHYVLKRLAGGPPETAGHERTKCCKSRRKARFQRPARRRLPWPDPQPPHGGPAERLVEPLDDSSAIRSSSCAHTASGQATVTSPPRSATGSAARRERLAGGRRPARCTSASSVAGASASVSGDSASRTGLAGARRLMPRAAHSRRRCSTRPSATATRSRPAPRRRGRAPKSVVVITLWPPARRPRRAGRGGRRRARS